MAIHNLNEFLVQYFNNHHCEIEENKDGVLTIQLNEKMDRLLMNRPFYWHYVKSTGQAGQPMKLTLITNPVHKGTQGEWIHFGSPRLQQILNHLKTNERYVKLFEQFAINERTPLYPWLVINLQISYQGKQKKDEIVSIGLNLINGLMKVNMMEFLRKLSLHTTIPDYCYTISPMIRLKSGFLRIENVILQYIEQQPSSWAEKSIENLNDEINTLKHFYADDEDVDMMHREIEEIKERYSPKITITVINGGLFYLKDRKE